MFWAWEMDRLASPKAAAIRAWGVNMSCRFGIRKKEMHIYDQETESYWYTNEQLPYSTSINYMVTTGSWSACLVCGEIALTPVLSADAGERRQFRWSYFRSCYDDVIWDELKFVGLSNPAPCPAFRHLRISISGVQTDLYLALYIHMPGKVEAVSLLLCL